MDNIAKKDDVKLIICDLDGTLLNDKQEITTYTKQILLQCKAQCIKLCFASGRSHNMIDVYNNILINNCDYIISNNGAMITKYNELLYKITINNTTTTKILEYMRKQNLNFVVYTIDEIYITKGATNIINRFKKYENFSISHGVFSKLDFIEIDYTQSLPVIKDAIKIMLYEENIEKQAGYYKFIEKIDDLCVEATGYGLIGAFNKNVSKKNAVQYILNDMNIAPENICVFGDYDNDLSMFECAKYKIAMGNAQQSLKNIATFITDTNNDDGVAKYLEKMLQHI